VALAEVRSTVTRLRTPDFGGEVEAARAALTTAGLTAVLPPAAEAPRLAGGNASLFSWVLREAVTNVVRHSGASRCEVRLSAEKLQIDDDGVGPGGAFGNGLNGLAERVEEAGGRLVVSPLAGADASGAPDGAPSEATEGPHGVAPPEEEGPPVASPSEEADGAPGVAPPEETGGHRTPGPGTRVLVTMTASETPLEAPR
jgi:hypothetical protein